MNVLYYTNKDITDWDLIPNIIKQCGDSVITYTKKLYLDDIVKMNIDFIVSDRARFLITADIIELFPRKIINLHPSYLPWNRGYHPNYWSIKDKTPFGVTIHYIDEGIDTGDIIAQTETRYARDLTFRDTYNMLRELMISLFKVCWPYIRNNRLGCYTQNKGVGSIHYKVDFNTEQSKLIHGWDTKISDILCEEV